MGLFFAKPNYTTHTRIKQESTLSPKTNDKVMITPLVNNQSTKEVSSSDPIEALIGVAKSKLKAPYKEGQSGPNQFDCSGFVYYLFKTQGYTVPRTSLAQSKSGKPLDVAELQIGDLVFFDTSLRGHINHSGIFLGDDRFIHASSGKANGVTISTLNGWYKDKFRWGIKNPLR